MVEYPYLQVAFDLVRNYFCYGIFEFIAVCRATVAPPVPGILENSWRIVDAKEGFRIYFRLFNWFVPAGNFLLWARRYE